MKKETALTYSSLRLPELERTALVTAEKKARYILSEIAIRNEFETKVKNFNT
jgi:hypothetical protein